MAISASAESPKLETYATGSITDLQATVTVLKSNQTELRKINRDFCMAYLLRVVDMSYKEPDKLRMEGKAGLMIVNGAQRYYHVPVLGLSKKETLGAAISRRHSLFDLGLVPRGFLESIDAKFIRAEKLSSVDTNLFEFSFHGDDTSRFRIWLDPVSHVILKREWLDGEGHLRATFFYQNVKEIKPGIWLPTRMEIHNADGELAGVTGYTDLHINQGLADTLFQIT